MTFQKPKMKLKTNLHTYYNRFATWKAAPLYTIFITYNNAPFH